MTTSRSFLLDENVDIRVGKFLEAALSALFPYLSSVQAPRVYELTSEGFRIHEIQK